MPVAVTMDFPGATLDQYDQASGSMGYTSGGQGSPGCWFHWVAATDTGIRVVDVWESKEQFEQFAGEQIAPAAREAGFPGAPEMQFAEVHAYHTPGPGLG